MKQVHLLPHSQPKNIFPVKVELQSSLFRIQRSLVQLWYAVSKHKTSGEMIWTVHLSLFMFESWGNVYGMKKFCLNECLNIMNSLSHIIWLHNGCSEPEPLSIYTHRHTHIHRHISIEPYSMYACIYQMRDCFSYIGT